MNVPGHPNTWQSLVQYNLAVLVLAVEISSKTDHASVLLLQSEEIFLVCDRCEQLIGVLKKLVFLQVLVNDVGRFVAVLFHLVFQALLHCYVEADPMM